ncbi:MAG: MATE family efflux transporter [Clostridiales bacterium]|nr:MATE family efflux transporter [Clostridiales bacterium]
MKRYIGDKNFYKAVLVLAIPLVIQQAITSFVNLLDNVMVGGLGTESISAVAVVNQIFMVFNLSLFGGLSGASIFGAQFFGKGDMEGMRDTFRFKMIFGVVLTIVGTTVLLTCGETFIGLFLRGESDGGSTELALSEGMKYLHIMLWGFFPFMVVQAYVSSLRETGETFAPMIASVIAILINLALNYLLIFGKFGFPRMGVSGAALATVISRYVEMVYVLIHAHRHPEKYHFLNGAYRSLHISGSLLGKIAVTGTPLMLNEVLWSLGMTFISQSYSTRGLSAMAAINITGTAWNLFCVMMFAMGSAVAIMVGQKLGAGDKEGARDTDRKLVFLTVVMHIIMGGLLILCSGLIPLMYNIEDSVRQMTSHLLIVAGASLPIHAYVHVVYFTIRSGGKTVITFLFDCVYTWVVPVALAYVLCHFTQLPVLWVYFAIQFIDIIKVIIGALMLRSDFWANNVVNEVSEA